MKRSEMCKIINEYMTGPRHNATASTLLQVIEDAGMMPPTIIFPLGNNYGMDQCTHVMKVNGEYVGAGYANRWELEDEK